MSKRDDSINHSLLDWIKQITPPPAHVQITPTNECNLNCIFCWRHDIKKGKDHIPDDKLLSLTREACAFQPDLITITGGGEPLLKPDVVISMASIIKQHASIRGEIITNGTLFDKEIVKKLISLKWDLISISINASTESLDDFLRGRNGTYEKTIEGLEIFVKFKRKFNSPFPHLKFNVVITKHNYNDVQNMVNFAAEYNASIQVRLVNEQPGSGRPLCIPAENYEEFKKELKNAENLAHSKHVDFYKDFTEKDVKYYLNLERSGDVKGIISGNQLSEREVMEALKNGKIHDIAVCTFPFTEINVFANGYAAPCGGFFQGVPEEYPESDLEIIESVEGKSLREIWYGEKFNRMRALMLLHHFPRACLACNVNFINVSRIFRGFVH
ncbi:MAG: radical SAM protein [Candidatus Aenigmarchaeota archaeon]|nr:radical SAM protein [Candidatus Aenigmarchaeota archaeon]